MTPLKNPLPSLLVVLLNVAWWMVALAMALTICLAGFSTLAPVRGGQLDIPVSFSVDPRALPVRAPSLGIEGAQIEHVRGTVKFSPPAGASLVVFPALLGIFVMFALALFVVGQLRAVLRTLRDSRPFVAANATRIRWIAMAVIAGEVGRALIVYASNSYVTTHFSASGLQFDARPDVNVLTLIHALIILAIAEVFRAGTRLDEDQSLTI
jgi:hypothetical protein